MHPNRQPPCFLIASSPPGLLPPGLLPPGLLPPVACTSVNPEAGEGYPHTSRPLGKPDGLVRLPTRRGVDGVDKVGIVEVDFVRRHTDNGASSFCQR